MLDGKPWQLAMHTLVVFVVSVVDIVAVVGIVVHLVVVDFLLMLCRHRRMLDDVGSYSRPSSLKQSPPHLRHRATQSRKLGKGQKSDWMEPTTAKRNPTEIKKGLRSFSISAAYEIVD